MNKTNSFKKKFPWGLMAFLAIGVAIAAIAPYATFNPANFNNATARFATESTLRYAGLFVHAFSGGIALILGPFQFLSRLRQRRPNLHRWMGRIYLLGILFGGLSAFLIAPGMISGLVGEFGLITLAILWLWTGFMAYTNIRAGNVEIHREWMIRNYALTFAAAPLRLWLGTLIGTQLPFLETKYAGDFDALFVEVYRVVMWISWVPNLIIAEMVIQRRRKPQTILSSGQNSPQTQSI
ncbi:MAG: DUF2306 domain-containing protein [Anaerolineales bacterium]|nr:DUF2306 domain-containing protein [Anaerolineales bacterium]